MRDTTNHIEIYRVLKFSSMKDGFNGLFYIPVAGYIHNPTNDPRLGHRSEGQGELKVVASDGFGWDHVSVVAYGRSPTNREMEQVRRLFWHRDETVVEYHDNMLYLPEMDSVPKERHLWSPQGCEVIRPPSRIFSPFLISIQENGVEDYQEVESSNIAAVRYSPDENALFVVFTSGGHYRYSNVPPSVYDGLMAAESVGRYFHANIRNDYPASKVVEETDD